MDLLLHAGKMIAARKRTSKNVNAFTQGLSYVGKLKDPFDGLGLGL